jgi:hypothetical protein
LQQLAGLGLVDAADASLAWPIRRSRARALLHAAHDSAAGLDPALLARISGWLSRLAEEEGTAVGGAVIAVRADAGYGYRSSAGGRIAGRLVPREGGGFDYTGPVAVPAIREPDAALAVDVSAGRLTIALSHGPEDDVRGRTRALYALFGTPSIEVWAGRRPLGFGPAGHGGIVLGDAARFDGFGLDLPAGFHLPSFLRALGEVRVSQTFARMDRSGPVARPWFIATRVLVAPSASLAIGLNRAALFGGEGNQGVTIERVFWLLLGQTDIGSKDSDFENQVVSLDVLWRPGDGAWSLYGEYGFDDAGAAFVRVPAFTLGASLARLPGPGSLTASAEVTHFTAHCCGHPPWYQHGALAEGWSDRGVLLGHPLGGEGTEASVAVRGDFFADARWIADVRGWIAHRGPDNLLAPDFAGRSIGGELRATISLLPNLRVILDIAGERFTRGRTRHDAWIGLRGIL